MDCDSNRGKGLWQQWLKKNIYYSCSLTCSVDYFAFFSFLFFPFPPSSVVVVDFIGTMKSKKLLSFFFPSSVTFFIVVINLCLYIGLLQFCEVFLFFFFSIFSVLILIFRPIIFYTFISLFAFPTVLFSLQLIFKVYKSS